MKGRCLNRLTTGPQLVGVRGFEPPAPCSQSTCATGLRYTPTRDVLSATLLIYYNPFEKSTTNFSNLRNVFIDLLGHEIDSRPVHLMLSGTRNQLYRRSRFLKISKPITVWSILKNKYEIMLSAKISSLDASVVGLSSPKRPPPFRVKKFPPNVGIK